jgi:tRNA dimethylallyltransferase
LARGIPSELVSADSRQIYRGFDVGTNKSGVAHQLIDIATPDVRFIAGQFLHLASKTVAEIRTRRNHPIVVGGTGLYIKALLEGLSPVPPTSVPLRSRLESSYQKDGEQAMRQTLRSLDPIAEKSIPINNKQRLLRALEVCELTGRPISESWSHRSGAAPGPWLCLRIDWPAEELRRRLQRRCETMWPALIRETRALLERFTGAEPAFEGVGYREALSVIEGRLPETDGYAAFVKATLAYAKRQGTWFRHQLKAQSIEGGSTEHMVHQAQRLVAAAA